MKSQFTIRPVSVGQLVAVCLGLALVPVVAADKPQAKAVTTGNKVTVKPTNAAPVSKLAPKLSPSQYTNPCFVEPEVEESAMELNGIPLPALDDELIYWYRMGIILHAS